MLRRLSDNNSPTSLANSLRRKRFSLFLKEISNLGRPLRILDLGGTKSFWEQMGFDNEEGVEITLLNLDLMQLGCSDRQGETKFTTVIGDARDLSGYQDKFFDIVFSNSVLEHVGGREDQRAMMKEVVRVGVRFFVQTPNYWFPVEPHFHVLGFQFMPIALRAWLLCHFRLGWSDKMRNKDEAQKVVKSVRLLSERQLRELCPRARIVKEKFFGFTKSFVLIGPT